MPTRTRNAGEICWINMLTPTPEAAKAFFGELFGWTFKDMAGLGYVVRLEGRDIGGMFDLHGMNTPKGATAGFSVMVKVADADATSARVKELGGSAKEAFDIMTQGRMAVCHDPLGAEFDLWQPNRMQGFDVDPRLHGAPTAFETITSDPARATAFYEALFGWDSDTKTMPGGDDYTTFSLDGVEVAGLMAIPPGKSLPSHWGVYFTVRNVDEAAQKAVQLGGKLCVPARDIPGVGRFCGVASPQGVICYPLQHAP